MYSGVVGTNMIRGHLESLLLAVLVDEPGHGYALSQRLAQRSGGELSVPEGSLYPALQRLERLGPARSSWASAEGRRRRLLPLVGCGPASGRVGCARVEGVLRRGGPSAGWSGMTAIDRFLGELEWRCMCVVERGAGWWRSAATTFVSPARPTAQRRPCGDSGPQETWLAPTRRKSRPAGPFGPTAATLAGVLAVGASVLMMVMRPIPRVRAIGVDGGLLRGGADLRGGASSRGAACRSDARRGQYAAESRCCVAATRPLLASPLTMFAVGAALPVIPRRGRSWPARDGPGCRGQRRACSVARPPAGAAPRQIVRTLVDAALLVTGSYRCPASCGASPAAVRSRRPGRDGRRLAWDLLDYGSWPVRRRGGLGGRGDHRRFMLLGLSLGYAGVSRLGRPRTAGPASLRAMPMPEGKSLSGPGHRAARCDPLAATRPLAAT